MEKETEVNPEGDPLMATLFRNAVIDGSSPPEGPLLGQ